ncbi:MULTISPECIES: hypothetical protein [unclassified Aureispira]|uniref:hypothetical protein n=1 Tax=unclassified Aureispira TaxID=2649989 RepID=UPI000697B56A|nr:MULTISPECIES: hypothetical protein [unclassified Aureispira]WMX13584.1 hypothetical protein QP953_22290 [Aureispira sp. CCB-E]
MKKLLFSCALAITAAVSFSSCAKDTCYVCEQTINNVDTKYDVCNDQVTITTNGTSSASTGIPGGISAIDYRRTLETGGYTCTNK